MDTTSVILAVASPPGRSARGIVRLSGPGALELVRPHVELDGDASGRRRGLHRATLRVGAVNVRCLALVFPAPASYTGEDAIELHLPGSPPLLERVVDGLVDAAGALGVAARRAEPGEFTARAYLGGRIDLVRAEAVAATIAATSDAALRAAGLLRSGALGDFARAQADAVASALALVEAGIDFTDQEDVVPIGPAELGRRIDPIRGALRARLEHAVGTEQLDAVPWVVLTGAPNAGKSTLFNALLGHPRAVVSPAAGTTRDVLTEPLVVTTDHGPAEVLLVDLAGAEVPRDPLSHRMQGAATEALERAELVIECVAGASSPAAPAEVRGATRLLVRTKADLGATDVGDADVVVSAFTREGLDELLAAIARRLADRAVSLAADATVLRPRHEAALRDALAGLDDAAGLLDGARDARALPNVELLAASLRTALDSLGALAGDVTPDDVLGRVFAEFCVGK
jgi:tRNA modification GTPase